MPITPALLVAAGASPHGAALYAAPLAASAAKRGIVSDGAVTGLLAELLHESAALTRVSEDLTYNDPRWLAQVFPSRFRSAADAAPYVRQPVKLANLVYADLGGWDFRGRGLGQLTGHANYAAYAADVGMPLSGIGAWMETPQGAADSACWYFAWRKCGPAAERSDVAGMRRLWAGSDIGLGETQKWWGQVTRAMHAGGPATSLHAGSPLGKPVPVSSPLVSHGPTVGERQTGLPIAGEPQAQADALMDRFNPQVPA